MNSNHIVFKHKRILFFPILFFLILTVGKGQNMGNSPYSTYGIGDLYPSAGIRNISMGNTSVANPNSEFLNIGNPALLPVNKFNNRDSTLKFTMLDFGLQFSGKSLEQGDAKQYNSGLNLAYFTFLFPFSKHWSSSIGLRPYSGVYNKFQSQKIQKDPSTGKDLPNTTLIEYFSQGSLNQFSFGNGVDISKNISLGLQASYLFGSVSHQNTAVFQDNISVFNPNKIGAVYKDFTTAFELKPGIAYRALVKDSIGSGKEMFLNVGATFSQLLNGRTKRSSNLAFVNRNQGLGTYSDTLQKVNYYDVNLPFELASGISLERTGKWMIATEFSYSNWSVHRDVYGQSFLNNSYSIGLGGEWKPAKNISLKSWEYRAGINYTKTPVTINGVQIDDISLSFGSTIPVGRKDARFKSKPLNKLNMALIIGTRGTTENNLVKENYLKVFLGILIQDKWFQRWKID